MKSPYYTCPIEAANMAQKYGIIFTNPLNDSIKLEYVEDRFYLTQHHQNGSFMFGGSVTLEIFQGICADAGKMEVHQQSLSIFEPQEGDYISHQIVDARDKVDLMLEHYRTRGNQDWKFFKDRGDRIKIIQRNGKPFIMPEVN